MRLRGAHLVLAAALTGSAALLISYVARLSFIGDEWQLLIGRRGWGADAYLAPFNENPIAGIAAVYRGGRALLGMGSALPFYGVSIFLFLLCALLLFVYLERRVGSWAAAIGAVPILFLGAAYEDLFWAFQMGFFGSIAAGLGALLALDREDRRGDAAACLLLVTSLAFGSVGLAFLAAAAADLALGRRPRLPRAFVAGVPAAVFAAWWLGWGQSAGGQVSGETALRTPRYVFDAAAGGLLSLLGRQPITASGHPPAIAQALLIVLIIGAGLRLFRRRPLPRGTGVALALALSFWILIGLDRTGAGRFALSSRYEYPSAVFILILAAELLRGVRIPRPAAAAVAVVAAAAVVGGISIMDAEFPVWRGMSQRIRLDVSALEAGRRGVSPRFPVSFPPSTRSTAGAYFAAVDRFGSPAYGEAALLGRPEPERSEADGMLVQALGIRLSPRRARGKAQGCRAIGGSGRRAAVVAGGTFALFNGESGVATVLLGRFAAVPSVALGAIPPRGERTLSVPADSGRRPWRIATRGRSLRLCGAPARRAGA